MPTPPRFGRGFVIGLLGAESTGKTTLAHSLGSALSTRDAPARVAVVGEYLREFCDRHGRTPRPNEQRGIAAEQTARIDAARRLNDIVIADTTALMIAVYSDHVFGDPSLYSEAEIAHARCDLTLLTGLDLAWQADGLQRDGPHVREPIDALVRASLERAGAAYSVIFGSGDGRLEAALASVWRAMAPMPVDDAREPRWQWHCERCGEPGCERHPLLPGG